MSDYAVSVKNVSKKFVLVTSLESLKSILYRSKNVSSMFDGPIPVDVF